MRGGLASEAHKIALGRPTWISLYPDSTELSPHVPLQPRLYNMIILM